jgi:homeobox-leucine zipper protein
MICILQDGLGLSRTLDLASTLEGGTEPSRESGTGLNSSLRSVLTIAFQFAYEAHMREACANMARQYVRTVVASVQRVAMALAPSRLPLHLGAQQPPESPDVVTLTCHILQSYRYSPPVLFVALFSLCFVSACANSILGRAM